MSKDDEIYIGSVSPVISVADQRMLLKVTRQMCGSLTFEEYAKIMDVYNKAIDRIFEENGVSEDDS